MLRWGIRTAPGQGRVFPFRTLAVVPAARFGPPRASGRRILKEGIMTVSDTQVTWLTQDAHDRLKNELDELVANRPVIAAKINDAREEGDLKENGGYHAAREEQAQLEARI